MAMCVLLDRGVALMAAINLPTSAVAAVDRVTKVCSAVRTAALPPVEFAAVMATAVTMAINAAVLAASITRSVYSSSFPRSNY